MQPPIPQNPSTAEARAPELVAKGPGANQSLAALAGHDNITVKPLVKHILSKELILYFNKVAAVLVDENTDAYTVSSREAALMSVGSEPGIHQLVPYFIHFINEKLTHAITTRHIPQQMMQLLYAMLENKSLFLDPYATALCPGIMTCLVGRTLGPDSSDPAIVKMQYDIRHLAASLLGRIVKRFKNKTSGLQDRLLRSCLKCWLDTDRTLSQHYGAILGIQTAGGPQFVHQLMLGVIGKYQTCLDRSLKLAADGVDAAVNEFNVHMVTGALVSNVSTLRNGNYQHKTDPITDGPNLELENHKAELETVLGTIVGSQVEAMRDRSLNKLIIEEGERDRIEEEEWSRKALSRKA